MTHITTFIFVFTNQMSLLSQYVTQTVEVESPATLKQLSKARQRNEHLSEKLSNQNERCKQLEEHIRKSDEYSCNLQHKVIREAARIDAKQVWCELLLVISAQKYMYTDTVHTYKSRLKVKTNSSYWSNILVDLCFRCK